VAITGTICEIHRYVRERSGRRNSWWFRRRVPGDLIPLIGQNEWRFTLKARNRDNAVAEAIPHLARTNETIELARRGEWPPITDEQAELIAYKWRGWCPWDIKVGEFGGGDPVFPDDAAFTASLTTYLAEHWPIARPGTRAFDEIKGYARGECRIETFKRVNPVQVRPDGKKREPVLLNHPDPAGDDLIREWADWRGKSDKSEYTARRMMLRFTEITGLNDITELTREHVETWITHLREKEKGRNGQPLAPNTIKSNLEFLRILLNFAIEKEHIADNPAAKIKFSARPKIKIRSYTNAEARLVLERARQETIPYRRWLPWLCCFTGCRLDEPAGAMVRDIEKVGPYWVLNVRLDHRHDGASIKTDESDRRVPLHPVLEQEGFTKYWQSLPKNGSLFPELRPDRFGSKGGNATKRLGPVIRGLADVLPSLADKRLHPSHSWRHRLHDEFRRSEVREDIEDAVIGHASDGSGPGYGEYAIIDMLGPAIEKTRSPFDVEPA
jgi:hypothetical protein